MLSFFPRGVLDEILNLIESVSEEFPSYSFKLIGIIVLILTTASVRKVKDFWRQRLPRIKEVILFLCFRRHEWLCSLTVDFLLL